MRSLLVFLLLLMVKAVSRTFWRHDIAWVGELPPGDPWGQLRITVILNHTSLFEWIWGGSPPLRFLWQMASHGVIPVADATINRPGIGHFFRFIGRHVVSISRERDHTWKEVMSKIDDERSLVVMAPEGRMMRENGLDKHGKPMTVRGGIADILEATPSGRMLIAYSGGLHHVQKPGERFPRLFQRVRLRLESLDIPTYRAEILAQAGERGFKRAVAEDLQRRRDHHCWEKPEDRPGYVAPEPG